MFFTRLDIGTNVVRVLLEINDERLRGADCRVRASVVGEFDV